MINLLPQDQQKEIRAAHTNTLLLRYLVLLVGALVFLFFALVITYFSLDATARQADATKTQNEQAATGYRETQAAATALRSELSAAKALFDNEIRYSKVFVRLSALLPEGTAVGNLSIDDKTFTSPTTLLVYVRGEQEARRLQESFSTSPYISSVSMGRVSTNEDGQAYPYTVELLFTFNRSIAQ